jgi:hypothetical protein
MTLAEVVRTESVVGSRTLRDVHAAGLGAIELLAQAEEIRARALAQLVEFGAVDGHVGEGYLTPQRHLIDGAGVSEHEANRLVRLVRFCQQHPVVAVQLGEGLITVDHAEQLRVLAGHVDSREFAHALRDLLDAALGVELAVFVDRIRVWQWRIQPDVTAEDLDTAFDNRTLSLQPGLFGGLKLQGTLDPAGAAVVADALQTRPDSTDTLDGPRSLAQRQADRLVELAGLANHLDDDADPTLPNDEEDGEVDGVEPVGARQLTHPTVDVIVDLPTLLGAEFSLDDHRVDNGDVDWDSIQASFALTGQTPLRVIQQFFCDASWRTLIAGGGSVVLDYTHAKPEINRSQRRAVQRRDKHCQFKGCDRHWSWCDIHHLRSKDDGGWDLLVNLVLLCRRHHTMVHQQGWQLWRDSDGRLHTTTP